MIDYSKYKGRGTTRGTDAYVAPEFLPEQAEWETGIYCLRAGDANVKADRVLGGVDGVANAPMQGLANRTAHLNARLAAAEAAISALQATVALLTANVKLMKFQPGDSSDSQSMVVKVPSALSGDVTLVLSDGTSKVNPSMEVVTSANTYVIRTN